VSPANPTLAERGGATDRATVGALRRLAKADPDLGRAWKLVGPLPDRRRAPGFATLLRLIVEQQVSVAAAAAIWKKLSAATHPVEPARFMQFDDAVLRSCGLSRPKIAYARHLAAAVADGHLDLGAVARQDDAAALAELVKVKGIGRWTGEIYLLFALERPDVWPAGDLALQAAVRRLKNLPARPTVAQMDELAEPWRPHRGAAARLLWRYYAATRETAVSAPRARREGR
jgi:DNA-3-methyladenine glycosylase II